MIKRKDEVVGHNDFFSSRLRIFQGLNQNGQADPDELVTPAENKIGARNFTSDDYPLVDRFNRDNRFVVRFPASSTAQVSALDR